MDLLWLDPQTFEILAVAGKATVLTDDGAGGAHDLQFTPEDLEWAKQVDGYAEKAQKAGQRGDQRAAIQHYRQALKLAPGCDLYLMSIGCCYANMGQTKIGIKYLERAAEISPNNARIHKNLVGARRAI
jgi:tetratricopeptide (TPR) repeat protein